MQAATPLAGMIHALTLLALMGLLGPWASLIPLPALAATLVYVAWNMSEKERFIYSLKGPKGDAAVLLVTFFLTLFIDLTVAVQVGVLLSAFIFLKKMSKATSVRTYSFLEANSSAEEDSQALFRKDLPEDILVFEVEGPLFFAASDILEEALQRLPQGGRCFILRLRRVPLIDGTGLRALERFSLHCQERGIDLCLCEANPACAKWLQKEPIRQRVGNLYTTLDQALAAVRLQSQ
jgi:SulP family sulfate permease